MRTGKRMVFVLALAVFMAVFSAAADGFSFGRAKETAAVTLPGELFKLQTAAPLRDIPVFRTALSDNNLILAPDPPLPPGCSAVFTLADGSTAEGKSDGGDLVLSCFSGRCRLDLAWKDGDTAVTVQYLIASDGQAELRSASAEDTQCSVAYNGYSGRYIVNLSMPDVSIATVNYDEEGCLTSSLLLGDERQRGSFPLTIHYDEYGRALSITAADLEHTYNYSRPQGVWFDDQGQPAQNDRLPSFDQSLHPAPAARPLVIGTLHVSEKNAGVDRNALRKQMPTVRDLTREDGIISFVSDADSAVLVADSDTYFSTEYGTLSRTDGVFTAESEELFQDTKVQLILQRGSITAVYRMTTLESVSDSEAGIELTPDGVLTLTDGITVTKYNGKGRLTEVRVQSADGATLIYNRGGWLTGWEMDEYYWTKEDGWHITAVSEDGRIIHPSVKQPAAIRLEDYPNSITIEE